MLVGEFTKFINSQFFLANVISSSLSAGIILYMEKRLAFNH